MHYSWTLMEAERAFRQAAGAKRRARLFRRLRGADPGVDRLPVHDEVPTAAASTAGAVRELPLDAITGTIEPGRAHEFDSAFRPGPRTRARWQRVWLAEDRGVALPPISVVRLGDAYAIRDGHHRVSVARARGAVAIDAIVAG
jgi:hypothetical protein